MSNSMYPTLKAGDIVVCAKKDPKNIEVGDIAVINPEFFVKNERDLIFSALFSSGFPVIHRIVEKKLMEGEWFFKTKGDRGWRIDSALRIIEKNELFILYEYDPSSAFIPGSEITKVVLKVVKGALHTCEHCGREISVNEEIDQEIIDFTSSFVNKLVKMSKRFEIKIFLRNGETLY